MSGGGSAEYQIRVLTQWDASSFQAYINEVRAGLASLASIASTGGGAGGASGVAGQLAAIRSSVQQSLQGAGSSADVPAESVAAMRSMLSGVLERATAQIGAALDQALRQISPAALASASRAALVAGPAVAQAAQAEQVTAARQLSAGIGPIAAIGAAPPGQTWPFEASTTGVIGPRGAYSWGQAPSPPQPLALGPIGSTGQGASARGQAQATGVGTEAAGLRDKAAEQVQAETKAAEYAAALSEARAASQGFVSAVTQAATGALELRATLTEARAASSEYVRATVAAATAKAQLAAIEAETRAGDAEYLAATGRAAAAKSILGAQESLARSEAIRSPTNAQGQALLGPGYGLEAYAQAAGGAAAARKEEEAVVRRITQQGLAVSEQYISDTAATAVAQRQLAERIKQQTLAGRAADTETAQIAVANTLEQRRQAELERVAVARAALNLETATIATDAGLIELTAQRKVLEQELNTKIKTRAEELGLQGGRGQGGGGPTGPSGPTRGGSFGEAFSPANMVQFAAFNAEFQAFFTLQRGLVEAIGSAVRLDQQLALIQARTQAIGQGDQFGALRSGILQTAANTGVAADQVAALATQFLGLYGNVSQANVATASAAQLIRVMGVSAATAGPQIAAMAEDFNVPVRQIGNNIIDAANKTGRSTADMAGAMAQLGPIAQSTHLSLNQVRGIVEAVGVSSAKSGVQIGDLLSRVLPEIQSKMPQLAELGFNFSQAARGGDTGAALKDILGQYSTMSEGLQAQFAALVGGPRQAQVIAGLARDPQRAIDAMNSSVSSNTLLADANAKAQDTMGGALSRLRSSATGLGEAILHSGLTQGLQDIINAFGALLHAVTDVFGWIKDINDAFGGLPVRIATATTAILLMARALQVLRDSQIAAAVGGLFSGGAAVAAEAAPAAAAPGGMSGLIALMTNPNFMVPAIVAATAYVGTREAVSQNRSEQSRAINAAETRPTAGGGPSIRNMSEDELRQYTSSASTEPVSRPGQRHLFGVGSFPTLPDWVPGGDAGIRDTAARKVGPGPSPRQLAQARLDELQYADQQGQVTALQQAGVLAKAQQDQVAKDVEAITNPKSAGDVIKAYDDLQKIVGAAKATPRGAGVLAEAGTQKAMQEVSKNLAQQTGLQLSTIGDVVTAYQQGDITYAQFASTITGMSDRVRGMSTQAASQALLQAQKAFNDALAAQAQMVVQFGTQFLAMSPTQAMGVLSDALQKLPAGSPGALQLQGQLQQESQKRFQQALQYGSVADVTSAAPSFTADQQARINADMIARGVAAPYQGIAAQQATQQAAQGQQDVVRRNLNRAGETVNQADLSGVAPVPGLTAETSRLGVGDFEARQQGIMARLSSDRDLATAALRASGAGALAIAQAIRQADQAILTQITSQDISQGRNPADDPVWRQAATAVQNSTATVLQNQQQYFAALGAYLTSLRPQDPINAAQQAATSTQQQMSVMGWSVGQLQRLAATGGASAEQLGLLKSYLDAQNQLSTSLLQLAQAQGQMFQSQVAASGNTLGAAQVAFGTAQQAVAGFIAAHPWATSSNSAELAGLYKNLADAQAQQSQVTMQTFLSQRDLTTAQITAAGDQIGAARSNMDKAQSALTFFQQLNPAANLSNSQQLNSLFKNVIDSQLQFFQTQQQIFQSQATLAEAQRTAAGDPIGAARIALDNARAALARYQAQYPGANSSNSAEYNNLQTQVANAQANSIQTQVSTTEQIIQNQLTLRQIGVGQAIARLRELLALAAGNTMLEQQIQVQIQNLIQQTEGQMNWNIGNIRMPTLYQARRLDAVGGNAGAYQDNRNQPINIHVYNAQDNQGAVNQLLAAVGGPSRTGNSLPIRPV